MPIEFSRPKPPASAPEAIKPNPVELLRAAIKSENPVNGSGFTITPEQRTNIEAVLSLQGIGIGDTLFDMLKGETLRDLVDYSDPNTDSAKKPMLLQSIKAGVDHAKELEST